MKRYFYLSLFVILILLIISVWNYSKAVGDEIEVCVKKSGAIFMIGDGFKRTDCKENEKLISWNIVGPQGSKGDKGDQGLIGPQGEPGLPAQHGAGNIAFMHQGNPAYLLKTDGTVWLSNTTPGWGGPLFTQITGPVSQLPVPVSDIVDWRFYDFLDKDGNYWHFDYQTGDNAWHKFGSLP